MEKGEVQTGLKLGRRRLPPLSVPGELFELYQPLIGTEAVMAWLNLRWLIHDGGDMNDIEHVLRYRFGMAYPSIGVALEKLMKFELLEPEPGGGFIVHEPLSADAFFPRFGGGQPQVEQPSLPALLGENEAKESPMQQEPVLHESEQSELSAEEHGTVEEMKTQHAAATAQANDTDINEDVSPGEVTDLDAVVQIYHKKIGMIGPVQLEKLRFWVEEQGMEAEVVALAIAETVASAKNPRINYLEGILKNWYNSGIRTLTDLMNDKYASQVLHPRSEREKEKARQREKSNEGSPNALAYQSVSPELIDRWKEMYPDEYE